MAAWVTYSSGIFEVEMQAILWTLPWEIPVQGHACPAPRRQAPKALTWVSSAPAADVGEVPPMDPQPDMQPQPEPVVHVSAPAGASSSSSGADVPWAVASGADVPMHTGPEQPPASQAEPQDTPSSAPAAKGKKVSFATKPEKAPPASIQRQLDEGPQAVQEYFEAKPRLAVSVQRPLLPKGGQGLPLGPPPDADEGRMDIPAAATPAAATAAPAATWEPALPPPTTPGAVDGAGDGGQVRAAFVLAPGNIVLPIGNVTLAKGGQVTLQPPPPKVPPPKASPPRELVPAPPQTTQPIAAPTPPIAAPTPPIAAPMPPIAAPTQPLTAPAAGTAPAAAGTAPAAMQRPWPIADPTPPDAAAGYVATRGRSPPRRPLPTKQPPSTASRQNSRQPAIGNRIQQGAGDPLPPPSAPAAGMGVVDLTADEPTALAGLSAPAADSAQPAPVSAAFSASASTFMQDRHGVQHAPPMPRFRPQPPAPQQPPPPTALSSRGAPLFWAGGALPSGQQGGTNILDDLADDRRLADRIMTPGPKVAAAGPNTATGPTPTQPGGDNNAPGHAAMATLQSVRAGDAAAAATAAPAGNATATPAGDAATATPAAATPAGDAAATPAGDAATATPAAATAAAPTATVQAALAPPATAVFVGAHWGAGNGAGGGAGNGAGARAVFTNTSEWEGATRWWRGQWWVWRAGRWETHDQ